MVDLAPTAAASLPDAVEALAVTQDHVLSRAQLAGLGVDADAVVRHVRARRWRVVGRAVVLHRGPPTRRQRWWCATPTSGSGLLAGLTALEAAGLRGWQRDEVHLLAMKSCDAVRAPGTVVHESRRPAGAVLGSAPPRTTSARAAVDAAVWSLGPRSAAGLLAAVVQQRLATPDELAVELRARRRVRHGAVLRPLVRDLLDGAQSLAEIDMGPLVLAAGLPAPRRQVVVRTASGRRYLDVEVVLADGTVLAIEVDGPHHLDPLTAWEDLRRQNEVVASGRVVVRFPSHAVKHEKEEVVAQLVRVRRGLEAHARTGRPGDTGRRPA